MITFCDICGSINIGDRCSNKNCSKSLPKSGSGKVGRRAKASTSRETEKSEGLQKKVSKKTAVSKTLAKTETV